MEQDWEIASNSDISAQTELKIWQGVKLEKQGKLGEAIDFYRQAIEINPQSSAARQILAIASRKQNQLIEMANQRDISHEQKMESLRDRGKQLSPPNSNLDTYLNDQAKQALTSNNNVDDEDRALSLSLISHQDRSQIEPQISARSMEELSLDVVQTDTHGSAIAFPTINSITSEDRATETQLEVARIYLQQALAYSEEQQWQQSLETCQIALKICPNLAEAYKTWGNILQTMGKKAEAIGYYAQAISLQPQMPEAYANLGSLYASQSKWQQALEYYEKSLALNPQSAGVNRSLARIWEELEEEDRALEYFLASLELEPKTLTPQQHFQLANELIEEEKLEQAIACYRHAVKLNPNFKDAYLQLAKALEEDGQIEEASRQYQKIIKLQTKKPPKKTKKRIQKLLAANSPKAHSSNPKRKLLSGKHQPQAALLASNQNALTPQAKGIIKGKSGSLNSNSKIDLAIKRYAKKVQSQPNSSAIRVNLGSLFAAKRQWYKSISCYQKAIELDSNSAIAYRNLAKVYRKIGKDDVAAEVLYRGYALEPENVSGEEHFRLGEMFLKQKKLRQATACYRWAIKFQPNLANAYLRLGEILESQNNQPTAIACYQKAIQHDPNNARAYFAWGRNLSQQENWQKAITCYQKAVKLKFNHWDLYHKLGDALSKLERWQESIAFYQKAIELKPDFSWSYNNLGDALLHLKRWWEAANCFQSAIKLNPNFAWSYYNLGEAFVELQRWDEAFNAYNQARSLDADLPQVNKKLGSVARKRSGHNSAETLDLYLEAIKQQPEDEENYLNAIDVKSNDPELYLQFGNTLSQQNRSEEAIFAYHMAIKNNPQDVGAYLKLGKTLIEQGRSEQAVDCYRRGVAANPDSDTLNCAWGEALAKQGKLDEAISALKQAIEINPNLISAHQQLIKILTSLHRTEALSLAYIDLGEALVRAERLDEARELFQKSLAINPQESAVYNSLGRVYFGQERLDEAISVYQQAIALKSDCAKSYKGLGDALSRQSKVAEATEAYRQAMQLDPSVFDSPSE